jgi:hypothetical protein
MWQQLRDLTGMRFGRLEVVRLAGFTKRFDKKGKPLRGSAIFLCKCDCGNETEVRGSSLVAGFTRSCRCLAAELAAARLVGKFGERSVAFGHRPNVMLGEKNPSYRHGRYAKSEENANA